MGPIHKAKSTRAKRGRSANSSPKPRRKPANIDTAAVDALGIGTELRSVVTRLERIESYIIVAGKALREGIEQADEVAVLLRSAIGDLLFEQIRTLQDVAAQCDGGPRSDRHEDGLEEDDEYEDEDGWGAS